MKKIENFTFLKRKAYEHCFLFVDLRAERIYKQIKNLETALTYETKSSAGDKHETGRAMIQLEREKLGQQLAEVEKTQQLLRKVPYENQSETVSLGNLVITDIANYYLSISAGEFKYNGVSVYCISGASPIGRLLLGKLKGDEFTFNKITSSIINIY